MSEQDLDLFEKELQGLSPAQPPAELLARLKDARPLPVPARPSSFSIFGFLSAQAARAQSFLSLILHPPSSQGRSFHLLRWLIPATALVITLAAMRLMPPTANRSAQTPPSTPSSPLKADSVQVDEQLVGAFDAVGRLPTGEPVRFRYQRWMDNLTVRDKTRGLVIEHRTPRVEVIPVSFETY